MIQNGITAEGYYMHTYAAFFDLDNTILDTSSGRLFIRYSYRNNLISHRELLTGLYVSFIHRLGLIDTEGIIRRWIRNYEGRPEKMILDYSRRFISEMVICRIRKGIYDEIDLHHKNDGAAVILSASMKFICNPVKEHLGIDDAVCSSLEVKNGLLTGRLDGSYCYGKEKLNRARSYCLEHGFTLQDAWYYADSIADLPLLEAVGNPVCVSPDRFLKRLALKRGWTIRDLD